MTKSTDSTEPTPATGPTSEELERWKRAHKRVIRIEYKPGAYDEWIDEAAKTDVYFRRIDRAVYERFLASIATDRTKLPRASERMLKDCVLWPSADALGALYEECPGLAASHQAVLAAASGLGLDFEPHKA